MRGRSGALGRRARLALLCALLLSALASGADTGAEPAHRSAPTLVGIVDTGVAADPTTTLGRVLEHGTSRSLVPGEGLDDLDGHGTEMAWIVHHHAPSARIAAVKVVDWDGATSDRRVAAAISHLQRRGASVVLVSLAGAEPLPLTRAAIDRATGRGVVVVTAAGNDGLDLGTHASYPGGYDAPRLLTVAAADDDGALLGSSNRGGSTDLVAPGVVATCGRDGTRVTSTGTSGAAALVAAASAERARRPDSSSERLRALSDVQCPSDGVGN